MQFALTCPNQFRGSINADDMGLGKTIQAIGVVNELAQEQLYGLIICPATLKINWRREFSIWASSHDVQILDGDSIPRSDANIFVINYDILERFRPWIDSIYWDILICDEAHYLKNTKSLRTKLVLGGRKKLADGSYKIYKPIKAERRLFLTGTPILNRPIELWPMIKAIDPKGWGKSFMKYALHFCGPKRGWHGWDFRGSSNAKELHQYLKQFMIRRLKGDVLKELPAKVRQTVLLQSKKVRKLLQREIEAYEEAKGCRDANTRIRLAGNLAKIRKAVALAKLPQIIERTEDDLVNGPLVVFVHHQVITEALIKHFGKRCVAVYGKTPMKKRDEAVQRFQSGKVDLFILQIQVAVGLTLTRSCNGRFAELDWVPGNMNQAEDRLHRIGQKDTVFIQHWILEGSLDERIVKKLVKKQEIIDTTIDGKKSDRIVASGR